MSEDPEHLLQRLRAAPSPAFLARLKARLDAQGPPSPFAGLLAPSAGHRPQRAWMWHVALPLVAIAALLFIGLSWQAARREAQVTGTRAPASHPPLQSEPKASEPPVRPLAASSAPRPSGASRHPAVSREPGAAAAGPLAAGVAAPGRAPDTLTIVGASALAPYARDLPLLFLVAHGPYDSPPGMRIEPASRVAEPLCGDARHGTGIAGNEGRKCPLGAGLDKTLLGHEVAFLARSVRSGALPLSARAIFLALAREVPDPSHPELLVGNPYRLWSDIDPALPADPIRVLGPPQSSQPGSALLAVLLQPGCLRVLPAVLDESQCQSVRSDDVYVEVPEYGAALVRELETHPTWLGLLDLELLAQSRDELAVSPVNGVAPAAASVLSGAYPAARPLYLYVSSSDLGSRPVLSNLVFRYRQLVEEGAVGGPHAALVSSEELQHELPTP
jgi:phosphate transport system substrate-binding protein